MATRAKPSQAPEADPAEDQVDSQAVDGAFAGADAAAGETDPIDPPEADPAGETIDADPAPAARSSLLRDLEAIMREAEGVDHVRHEAMGALISRLSALKHHLARTESLDVAVLHPSLAMIHDLL